MYLISEKFINYCRLPFGDHLAGCPGHQWNQCSRVLQHGQRAQQVKRRVDESTYWIGLSLFINFHGQVASGAEAWGPGGWEVLGIFNSIKIWWKFLCNRFGHSCSCFQSPLALYFPWPRFRQQRWFLTQQLLWCWFFLRLTWEASVSSQSSCNTPASTPAPMTTQDSDLGRIKTEMREKQKNPINTSSTDFSLPTFRLYFWNKYLIKK